VAKTRFSEQTQLSLVYLKKQHTFIQKKTFNYPDPLPVEMNLLIYEKNNFIFAWNFTDRWRESR
jgi:hypothetical protein